MTVKAAGHVAHPEHRVAARHGSVMTPASRMVHSP
jgi:hypothetical protein